MIPFVLLALSICAVWAPDFPAVRGKSIPSWLLMFAAAVASAAIAGYVTWPAVASIALLVLLAWGAQHREGTPKGTVLLTLTVALALAIALHRIPGFSNPLIVDRVRLTPDAAPFTLYANFDKGAAGVVLLAFFAQRVRAWKDLQEITLPTLLGVSVTSAVVFAAALTMGYVDIAPKFPDFTWTFLAINLFFTCVAEEAMFRGLLQERMRHLLQRRPGNRAVLPVILSALLFGAAHLAGGLQLVLLATLAGLGYSWAYARTRRIEAAILVHFFVNAVQFLLLTYPHLQR